MGREEFTATEPTWNDDEIVSTVIPVADEPDTDERDYWAYNHGWVDASGGNDADRPTDERGLTGAEGAPIDAGPALTAEQAACELAEGGRSLDEARGLVRDYLDDVSERVGASAHRWGLDDADLDAIRTSAASSAAASAPQPDSEAERREQLASWQADTDADTAEDILDSGRELTP
jgi:hypothetical protein